MNPYQKLIEKRRFYLTEYEQKLKELERFKQATMDSIVTMFKTITLEPLPLGNTVFYYVNYNGRDVPAYVHANDYRNGDRNFQPIYDEDETLDFGWTDFKECCRIFGAIREKIMG